MINVVTECYSVLWVRGCWRVVVTGPASGPVQNEGQRFSELRADDFGCAYVVEYGKGADWRPVYEFGAASIFQRSISLLGDDVRGDLAALAASLPESPTQCLVALEGWRVLSRPLAALPPDPSTLRPDGSEWDRVALDEFLGADPVVHGANFEKYRGVCAVFGRKDNYRVIISSRCTGYELQKQHATLGAAFWFPVKGCRSATLAGLLGKSKAYGLKKAVAGLPDDPADALPDFHLYQSAVRAAYALTDWRRDSYGKIALQCENWRVIVLPDSQAYMLQTVQPMCWDGLRGSDAWVRAWVSSDTGALLSYLESGKAVDVPPQVAAAVRSLPVLPSDCDLAELPRRPRAFELKT